MNRIFLTFATVFVCLSTHAQSVTETRTNIYLENNGDLKIPIKPKKPIKLNAGFLLAPQAELDLKKIDPGLTGIAPLHLAIIANKGKSGLLGFYTVNYNLLGTGLTHTFSKKFGMYLLATKSIKVSGTYTGIGATTPVKDGMASAFIEVGKKWNTGEPYFYTGLIIPYLLRK